MPRLTMQLPPHVYVVLGDLSKTLAIPKVLVARRSLTLYARALQAVQRDGFVLAICTRDGQVVREILLDL